MLNLNDYPDAMSVADVKRALGLESEKPVRRAIARGELRSRRMGRRVIVFKSALHEFEQGSDITRAATEASA